MNYEEQIKYNSAKIFATWVRGITTLVVSISFLSLIGMYGCPKYKVWQQGLEGQAELARATQNRQIKIQESQAKADAAVFEMNAEITRAKGVAQANDIIGASLKGNTEYLHYLWINALNERTGELNVVYVPTEANIPIMEATRLKQ